MLNPIQKSQRVSKYLKFLRQSNARATTTTIETRRMGNKDTEEKRLMRENIQ